MDSGFGWNFVWLLLYDEVGEVRIWIESRQQTKKRRKQKQNCLNCCLYDVFCTIIMSSFSFQSKSIKTLTNLLISSFFIIRFRIIQKLFS